MLPDDTDPNVPPSKLTFAARTHESLPLSFVQSTSRGILIPDEEQEVGFSWLDGELPGAVACLFAAGRINRVAGEWDPTWVESVMFVMDDGTLRVCWGRGLTTANVYIMTDYKPLRLHPSSAIS